MKKQQSTTTTAAPPLTLVTLAERLGELHRTIEAGIEVTARQCVEMHTLLTEAKQKAGPSGWLIWLHANEKTLGFGERQAQRYLREPDVRTSDLKKEAKRKRTERREEKILAKAMAPVIQAVKAGRLELQADCAGEMTMLRPPEPKAKPKATSSASAPEPERPFDAFESAAKRLISEIRKAVKERKPVEQDDHDQAIKAIERLTEALETVAPRWQCQECEVVLDEGDEPVTMYECGECGERMDENRCEQCNKFAAKISDETCAEDGCEGEMELVGWETVAEQIAKQEKEATDEFSAQQKKYADEAKFEKSPEGKKAAKVRAEAPPDDASADC